MYQHSEETMTQLNAKMKDKKLPEMAIIYLQFTTKLLCSWPLSTSATSSEKIINEIKWWSLFLLAWSLELPIIYTIYLQRNNFIELTAFVCYSSSVAHTIIKMIICKRQYKLFQKLINEMEEFIKNADSREREALDSCVRQAGPIHAAINSTGLFASITLILGPMVLDQALPTETQYPFDINYYPLLQIIYINQSIIILQCGSVGPLDGQVCILLWFTIARLKLLAIDMKNITSIDDLNRCVRIHQFLLSYMDEAFKIVRPMILTTVATATVSIVFGGIHIVGNEPFSVKIQFVGIDIAYGSVLFMSALAAENLMLAVNEVQWSLYNSSWSNSSRSLNTSVIFIMQRLNKLPRIALDGFIPELSMNYYAVYLSKAMSFFTTLHVMLDKMNAKTTEN